MTNPLRSIRGSVVLVTGAASGMGRATARLFGEEGAHVAVTDVNAAGAEAVAGEILAAGGSARAWAMDVGDAIGVAVGTGVGSVAGAVVAVGSTGVKGSGVVSGPVLLVDEMGYQVMHTSSLSLPGDCPQV